MSILAYNPWRSANAETRRVLLISIRTLLDSIQLVFLLVLLTDHLPVHSSITQSVFPEWQRLINPERDVFYYRLFAGSMFVIGVLRFMFQKKPATFDRVKRQVVIDLLFTILLLTAAFKGMVFSNAPQLSTRCFYVVGAMALIYKLFSRPIDETVAMVWAFMIHERNRMVLRSVFVMSFVTGLIAAIYIPDPQRAIARMFVGDHLQHFDGTVMAAGWAFFSGNVLDMDTISQYGIGLPVLTGLWAKCWGGFDYVPMLRGLVLISVGYFLVWFFILRSWLGSVLISAAAVLFAVRLQMFHDGVFPLVYSYPATSVVRFMFDCLLMLLIFMNIRLFRRWHLFAAAVVCSFSIFNVTSEGVYQTAAFYFYLLLLLTDEEFRKGLMRSRHEQLCYGGYFFLVPLTAFMLFYSVLGSAMFTEEFLKNLGEFINYFLSGFGLIPMVKSLGERNYLISLTGFLIPAIYVLNAIILGSGIWLRKITKQGIFPLVLSMYGLATYTYYVARSAPTSYWTVGLPFVFIVAFWVKLWLDRLTPSLRLNVSITFFLVAVYVLMTNHNFIAYPNALNVSRNPMVDPVVTKKLPDGRPYFNHLFASYPQEAKLAVNNLGETDEELFEESTFSTDQDLIDYFRSRFDFSQDAQLINKLTSAQEKVALLSSFDVRILMQAKRRPLFYYFPTALSRPMRMRMYPFTSLYTTEHLKKTIEQLDVYAPKYIFMERILLNKPYPPSYEYQMTATLRVLEYIRANYEPYETGLYLVAMKRKEIKN